AVRDDVADRCQSRRLAGRTRAGADVDRLSGRRYQPGVASAVSIGIRGHFGVYARAAAGGRRAWNSTEFIPGSTRNVSAQRQALDGGGRAGGASNADAD